MVIDKKARQKRGKFYTPAFVSEFCWRVLRVRVGDDKLHCFRVVDPAAGDGVFLKVACEKGWVDPAQVTGVELYPGELYQPPTYRLIHGNGLLDQPESGFRSGAFDLVIGNPPYGGDGIRGFEEDQKQKALAEIVRRYDVWRESARVTALPDETETTWLHGINAARIIKKLTTYPIEQLFFERFLMLCDDGGWCVIVLPEGLLANQRTEWLRRAVNRKASVEAIVSLPSRIFAAEGTSARTAILFLQKKTQLSTPVYMVSPTYLDQPGDLSLHDYLNHAELEMTGAIPTTMGIWLDRGDWTAERWDPGFWNPRFKKSLLSNKHTVELGEFIESITYGPIIPGRQPEWCEDGIPLIGQKQLAETGIDLENAPRVIAGSVFDPPRSQVKQGDLLLARSGEGALLRFKMGVYEEKSPANVSCFVDRIRLAGIDPYFVWLVLKSRFLRTQILRLQNGVGTPNLSFREIRSLRIPLLNEEEQLAWRNQYRSQVAPLHNQRVLAQNKVEKAAWSKQADRQFKVLIQRLESLISERYDIH